MNQVICNMKMEDLIVKQHNVRGLNANKIQVVDFLDKHNVHAYLASETFLKIGENFFLKKYSIIDQRRSDD